MAAAGHTVLSPVATRRLLGSAARRDGTLALIDTLTRREREVLACLGHGHTNAEIARRPHLAETTVKGHVSRILVKLDCTNRSRAGLLAQHAGL